MISGSSSGRVTVRESDSAPARRLAYAQDLIFKNNFLTPSVHGALEIFSPVQHIRVHHELYRVGRAYEKGSELVTREVHYLLR